MFLSVKFTQRKINAVKAYNEWQAMRPNPSDKDYRIWRKFSFGKLFELDLWDTRQCERQIVGLLIVRNPDFSLVFSDDRDITDGKLLADRRFLLSYR